LPIYQNKDDKGGGDNPGSLGVVLCTGGVAEAWKDNLLDELAKGKSEVETAEQLFSKIRNDFGETSEEKRKIEQLQTIEQEGRMCDEYIQEFKKVARGSSYEGRPLIKEFKKELNGAIRRKLAEAEELPSTIGEWQERVVRLDRNQRQSCKTLAKMT